MPNNITEQEIFEIHKGGKISTQVNYEVKTDLDLAKVYTPSVAKVCQAIGEDIEKAKEYTIKSNTVAVFSDGSAILGLGDLGPEAALPVMEGKAMLFKELAGINAFPICVKAKTVDEIVSIAKALEPTFAGFNLEDISAPRCFEIEKRLNEELDVPVMHDDQHGTAVVVLAGLYNSLKVTKQKIEEIKVVFSGSGAAGIATAKLFLLAGVLPQNLVLCDKQGAIYKNREGLSQVKQEIAEITNTNQIQGTLKEVLTGANVFVGLSGPNLLDYQDLQKMANNSILFGLSNPIPEFDPEKIPNNIAVMATGRSDYPNQINNVLVFPGFFKGLFDIKAKKVTTDMKLAAARAISEMILDSDLNNKNILPKALDKRVVEAVAKAVAGK
jgi:malate dehydrogenase (oxaloacetate-decarboxylating)